MGNSPSGPQNGQPNQPQQHRLQRAQPQEQQGPGFFEVLQHAKAEQAKYDLKVAQDEAKSAAKLAEVEYQKKLLDKELLDYDLKHQEQMAALPSREVVQMGQQVEQLIAIAQSNGQSAEEIRELVEIFTKQAKKCGAGCWQPQEKQEQKQLGG